MSQVLLVEDNPSIGGILKLNAFSLLGLELIEIPAITEALSYVKTTPDLDLIICREGMPGSLEILTALANSELDIPLIWIGHQKASTYKYTIMMPANVNFEGVLEVIGKVLGIDSTQYNLGKHGEFEAVDCYYFFHVDLSELGSDVYLKLKKDGVDHFVKCLHHTDKFTKEDIEKYILSGLKEFFIPKESFPQFVSLVTSQFKAKLNQEKMIGEERISVTGDAYKITMDRIHSLGLDALAVDVAEASIKSMKSSIKEDNALGSFLKLMNGLPYAYANAYLTCLMCHKVGGQFSWITKSMREKLTYVAYFHNCSLKDEKLMKIISSQQLEESMLTLSEREVITGHAQLSALLVEGISSVPSGVSTIIKEHHGAKNGFGFPKNLSTNISTISMMFIVIEDFVDSFLKVSEKPTKADFEKIYLDLSSRYTNGTYLQTMKVLKELVFKNYIS
ncbi:MAG: response regulator [Bdellovibrionales bacterium]|nr:response regulator [Bdellovibrionales bacterium]